MNKKILLLILLINFLSAQEEKISDITNIDNNEIDEINNINNINNNDHSIINNDSIQNLLNQIDQINQIEIDFKEYKTSSDSLELNKFNQNKNEQDTSDSLADFNNKKKKKKEKEKEFRLEDKYFINRTRLDFVLGYNIGATSPIPLPKEVRKVINYNPEFNPHVGFEISYIFNKKWAFVSGFYIDWFSMRVKDRVKYMYTSIIVVEGGNEGNRLSGYFVGKNMTKTDLSYFTIPFYASYNLNKRWDLKLGFYASKRLSAVFEGTVSEGYMRIESPTGEKQEIDKATFDFSDNIRNYDVGIIIGANYKLNNKLRAQVSINWGLLPFFYSDQNPINFEMYNLNGTIGFSYRL